MMANEEFRAMLDLYMVSDPWPLEDREHKIIGDMLDREAGKFGYEGWVEAYHFFSFPPEAKAKGGE